MPLRVLNQEIKRRGSSRAMLFGPPNTFKTTAGIATAPYPLQILSPPGESGWATIPADLPGLTAYVWEEPPSDPVTAESMRKEIEDTAYQIIGGKKGPCRTLMIDGFHKQYEVYLNVATAGMHGRGEEFEAQKYGRAHQMAMTFLRKVLASPIEYVIVTTWNAKELDRSLKPGERARDVDSHEWPDLPGKMAKLIVGQFSVVAFSRVKNVPGKPGLLQGEWVLKPDADIWGASVKIDPRVIAELPARVPQDWKSLFNLVATVEDKVKREAKADDRAPVAQVV